MISKIPSYTQQWTSSTSKTEPSKETASWTVAKAAAPKPVEAPRTETRPQTEVTPARTDLTPKLNPLGYGNPTMPSSNFNSSIFKPPTLNTLQAIDTWQTIQANTFMPVPPSLGGVPLNTTTAMNPYGGANGSLGTNLLTGLFSKLT
jgi:hypothetical protein